MSRRRQRKTHVVGKVICYRESNNHEEQEEYQHEVSISSIELNYQGQKLKVNIEQFNDLRILTDGSYCPMRITNIDGQSNIQMTVENFFLHGSYESPVSPVDLATLESLNSKNCSYVIGYYGAVLDKSRKELYLCMESMDASMENFYKTIHSLDNLTNVIEWKHILCRLINNIASALNFLTINGINHRFLKPSTILVNKQALFKLCDIGITRQDSYVEVYPTPHMFYYYPSAVILKDAGYNIHPEMWTFGVNLLEIIIGKYPFCGMNPWQLLESTSTSTPTFPSNPINLEEIQEIIIKLLKTDKQQPQNYTEILEIPCIKNVPEEASNNEIEFVCRIIDNIPSDSD